MMDQEYAHSRFGDTPRTLNPSDSDLEIGVDECDSPFSSDEDKDWKIQIHQCYRGQHQVQALADLRLYQTLADFTLYHQQQLQDAINADATRPPD